MLIVLNFYVVFVFAGYLLAALWICYCLGDLFVLIGVTCLNACLLVCCLVLSWL